MRVQIRIEGTSEEVSNVLRALPGTVTLGTAAVELSNDVAELESGGQETAGHESNYVSLPFARHVLTRLGLLRRMRAVLAALHEAHPGWVILPKLHEITEYTPAQFAGLLGAFGRRIANTEGYDESLSFIQRRWNDEEGTWEYRIPKSVCDALALEELV